MGDQRSSRPRRAASARQLRVLRLAGWRYSITRDAWVHWAFRGRVGPVFIDSDDHVPPGLITTERAQAASPDDDLLDAMIAHLPAVRPPVLEQPLLLERKPPTVKRVLARLPEDEEPRSVVVDGRPPRRGVERSMAALRPVMVPPPAQATG